MRISRIGFPDTEENVADQGDETNSGTDTVVRQHFLH
jgi:hypothetical protein